jgi:hypothetical protein
MTDQPDTGSQGRDEARPLTYHQASSRERRIVDARERYEALTARKLAAETAAILRERGEFDVANPVHASLAESEPLAAADHLEMMAAGEVMARYYRHPAMLNHAAKAGATWEQIGDARGTSADQARQDYRDLIEGQHDMWASTGVWAGEEPHRFGMTDAEHAEAMQRLVGDAPPKAYAETHQVLCAHADQDAHGAHWLEPGEKCPGAVIARLDAELEPGQ